jgi:hypothetical protein
MARSISELLPAPFAALTLEHVTEIIAAIGDERETLFFERKEIVTGDSLAKACAAFANTYGGLLVVGVPDEGDELVGIPPMAAEAQLWVKDTLRGRVLPIPPFRARWLPTTEDRGLLLVLVEESTATPHLLTRSGTIYVRNPGSSDPVPIADQGRLLDLTRRGIESESRATHAALEIATAELNYFDAPLAPPIEILGVAPTGVTAEFETKLMDDPTTPAVIGNVVWGEVADGAREGRTPTWDQTKVTLRRFGGPGQLHHLRGDPREGVVVTRGGVIAIWHGYKGIEGETQWPDALEIEYLTQRLEHDLNAAREILLEFGAHGDLRLAYRLVPPQGGVLHLGNTQGRIPGNFVFRSAATLDDDDQVPPRFARELTRAAGVGPA